MAKNDKVNLTNYSSANADFPKNQERQTQYASKKVLSRVGGAPRRAESYTLESKKK